MEFDETKKCKRVKFIIGPIRIDLNPLVTIASAIIIWGFVIWCIIQPKSSNREFLKWARFVLFLFFRVSFGGRLPVLCWSVSAPPLCHQCHLAKNEMCMSEVFFACPTWLYGLFVRTLILRTNAYAGCGRLTLNFDLGCSVQTAKPTQ